MIIISPKTVNENVEKLLNKMGAEYEPELVRIMPEPFAVKGNCYGNVAKKVAQDGGKIKYGWTVWQSTILCEAEHHAVWENDNEELIDVTPGDEGIAELLFVPDDNAEYTGTSINNWRVNITKNPLVDDFIELAAFISYLGKFDRRLDDSAVSISLQLAPFYERYAPFKDALRDFIYDGSSLNSKCLCGSLRRYKNCCGYQLQQKLNAERRLVVRLGIQ